MRSARTLSVFIVVLLLTTSALLLVSSHASSSGGIASDSSASAGASGDRGCESGQWSWRTLAKDDGSVDVIVLFDPERQDASAVEAAIGEAGLRAASANLMGVETGDAGITNRFEVSISGFSAVMTPESIEELISSTPDIEVYPDITLQATLTASVGPIGASQVWAMDDAFGLPVTGAGIVVAVIDTGIDYTHPDLGGGFGPTYKVIGGYDFVNDDSDPMDDNGHGTHVAGIIAADGGMTGVAPDAKLMAYKALGANGQGSMSDVIAAIDAAMDPNGDGSTSDHVDIISMSLGGPGQTSDPVCQAAERAVEAGIAVVVAAGNLGPMLGSVATPGLAPSVITVGAVDDSGVLAAFSSRGPTSDMTIKPEVSAPGVDIVSTVPYSGAPSSSPSGYLSMSGTSMATPHVSGAAALLLQLSPDWTPGMLKSAMVSYSKEIDESIWTAGTGMVWLPDAANATMFSEAPLVSYGLAGASSKSATITNLGNPGTFTLSTHDWLALNANGTTPAVEFTDISGVSPASTTMSTGGTAQATISVPSSVFCDEGYYGGYVRVAGATTEFRLYFGFVVLSTLNVHVIDMEGREVFDPYGGVWVYNTPDASVAMGIRGDIRPAPPATFFLPSDTYSVHALGHQLIYSYDDPYLLSSAMSLGRLQTADVYLRMDEAHEMTASLETAEGQPIYVKDFRMYCRHEGSRNVSFDITGSDYSIVGAEVFSITDSLSVYVSDTDASVGVAVSGFAYTAPMWEFMNLNRQNWFEYASGASTAFMVEASADLQYLLAWEFDGVDPTTGPALDWSEETSAGYLTKYDIPGTIQNPWSNWGTHRSIGGDAVFFVRRDTDTSLNPFFSGMTRTTYVQGTFSELYFPRSVVTGFSERQYFAANYDHVVKAASAANVYLPDRSFIQALPAGFQEETLGAGPFYPSVFTVNSDDSLEIFHPLLRDQSGAKVGAMYVPSMYLYRDGGLVGVFQLSEHQARPDALRVVALPGDGTYTAKISCLPSSQISTEVSIELGFAVPSADPDPPRITGLEMAQRFVPGDAVPMTITATDDSGSIVAEVSWRAGDSDSWHDLSVVPTGMEFTTSIPTAADTQMIDLRITLTDDSGNFISAEATNAALAQVPVVFELAPQSGEVEYRDSTVMVVLEGRLTDLSGNPLSSVAGVPLELTVAGQKVGMLLDEYVVGTTHVHNGDIRFEWKINTAHLFASVGETVEVLVDFNLGVYEPISRSFTLTSIEDTSMVPVVTLNSPVDGALFAPGETIDLSVGDDGMFTATVSVDGAPYYELLTPWDISTSDWCDGAHTVDVHVVDDDGMVTQAAYGFVVDGSPPEIDILRPIDGAQVPMGFEMQIAVSDDHLSSVTYARDGGPEVDLDAPYTVDLMSWETGAHTVRFSAHDSLGHSSSASIQFEIVNSTVVAVVADPAFGAVIRPGTPIDIEVYSTGTVECFWSEDGVPYPLVQPFDIDTTHWLEGLHQITVEASDDLGGESEIVFEVVIDDTVPVIVLVSPSFGSHVTPETFVTVHTTDINLQTVSWSVFGIAASSESATNTISVAFVDSEGYFSVAVSAVDLAGNTAQENFAFVMDLEDPEVSIAGVESGGAILPGTVLTFSAQDTYISYFAWSLDGEPFVEASTPFDYSTEGLSAGWHQITLVAEDRSGRIAEKAVSFYVDDSPPTIVLDDEYEVESGRDLVLRVVAVDDFGVGGGTLCYESSDGVFESIGMTLNGAELVATLDADVMWDTMEIYVIVEDEAGNTFQSATAVVSVAQSSSTTPGPDAADDGTETTDSESSSLAIVLALGGAVAAALFAIVFLASRRGGRATARPAAGHRRAPPSPGRSRHAATRERPQAARARPTTAMPKRPSPASGVRRARPESSPLDVHRMAVDEISNEIVAQGIACAIADHADECDDVERQLLSIISRGSVYGDVELSSDAVIDDDNRHRAPTVVSGLGLSRKMRREYIKKDAS